MLFEVRAAEDMNTAARVPCVLIELLVLKGPLIPPPGTTRDTRIEELVRVPDMFVIVVGEDPHVVYPPNPHEVPALFE